MFVDTIITGMPNKTNGKRPSPEALLAMLKENERANLRLYIGAAAGVGKTFQMLQDAHALSKQGVDVVVGVAVTHGREDTAALIGDLEVHLPITYPTPPPDRLKCLNEPLVHAFGNVDDRMVVKPAISIPF